RREWLAYLERGFAENRPWDRTVRDMVLARPEAATDRGSIWFLYGRRDQYQQIAEAVSSSVLGVQVQCAQCHNHFVVPEILRMDSQHPPSHPELLDWLASDFERSGYDVKRLVRAIVLSRPYQLEARHQPEPPPASAGTRVSGTKQANAPLPPDLFAASIDKPL